MKRLSRRKGTRILRGIGGKKELVEEMMKRYIEVLGIVEIKEKRKEKD